MSGAGAIKHSGEVIRIDGSTVYVKMVVGSACGSCQARAVCGASEMSEKIVEVETSSASEYEVGDIVQVALYSRSMGVRSVVLAYVIPIIILCAGLFGGIAAGMCEGLAAIAAIGGVAIYYAALYLLRDRVGKTIKFIITKQTK